MAVRLSRELRNKAGARPVLRCSSKQRKGPIAYARFWGQAIPRCGAGPIGYFAPDEGSATTTFGIYNIDNLAAYEAYRERLRTDPIGRSNYECAETEQFIRR